jgi:hypothetical protein
MSERPLSLQKTGRVWIAGSIKNAHLWDPQRVTSSEEITMGYFGRIQQKIDPFQGRFFVVSLAVPTGFEPAISALTGPHVWPLHHGTSFSKQAGVSLPCRLQHVNIISMPSLGKVRGLLELNQRDHERTHNLLHAPS